MNSETGGRWTRRQFLGGTAVAVATGSTSWTGPRAGAAAVVDENPWRYDVDRLRQVDPAMIGYERVSGFAVASPGVRRLVWTNPRELWVTAGRSLLAYDLGGATSAEVAIGDVVRCLTVAPDGRLIVGLRDRVEIYDREGQRLARWPAITGKPFLTGLALGDDMLFVADSGNRVVYRCDLEGRIQVRIGEKNPARSIPGLVLPSPFLDVEMGGDGLLRVTNPGRHRVEVYTVDGALELAWGRAGVALDAFCGCCNPIAVSLLGDGRVVTAEKGLPRVKVYGAAGRLETVVAGPNQFAPVGSDERSRGKPDTALEGLDVAVGPDGRVAVLDLVGSTVQVFQPKGAAAVAA